MVGLQHFPEWRRCRVQPTHLRSAASIAASIHASIRARSASRRRNGRGRSPSSYSNSGAAVGRACRRTVRENGTARRRRTPTRYRARVRRSPRSSRRGGSARRAGRRRGRAARRARRGHLARWGAAVGQRPDRDPLESRHPFEYLPGAVDAEVVRDHEAPRRPPRRGPSWPSITRSQPCARLPHARSPGAVHEVGGPSPPGADVIVPVTQDRAANAGLGNVERMLGLKSGAVGVRRQPRLVAEPPSRRERRTGHPAAA